MNTKTFCFLIGLSLVLLVFNPSYADIPILGYDTNGGRVFEENNNKYVLWGVDADTWGCEAGNDVLFREHCRACVYINANCIAIPITWKMLEANEGVYDFTHFDKYLNIARQYSLKATILWVGSDYAAGDISFVPDYIINDTSTYTRITGLYYNNVLCPSCQATLDREKLAYVAMVQHLADVDSDHRTVMAICSSGEFNYVRALSNWSPPEQNVRCTCSHCNAAYQGGNNVTFMTEQYANYTKTLIEAGAAYYDIPTYSQVCPHKFFPGWRYAENPVMFKSIINRQNHFTAPSIVETSSASVFVTEEMDYFLPSNIPGNIIFIDGIGTQVPECQPHIEMAPWYSILWYGGLGAVYWDASEKSVRNDAELRTKFRKFWGPLKGIHYYLARLKSSGSGVKFWWQYLDTDSSQSMNNFTVHQTSSAQDYGVCFEISPNDLTFTCSTYAGSCTITVTHAGGFDGYRFEKGYFHPLTGQWFKKDDVYPVIAGNDATLMVDSDSGDYMRAVYRYYIYIAGDLNHDGKVDMCDLSILVKDWLKETN